MAARVALLLMLVSSTLAGCVQFTLLRPGALKPATAKVAAADRAAVWQHAIDVLLDEGFLPDLLNEAACFIRAKQRSDLLVDSTLALTAVVTIDREGVVRVEVAGAGYYSSDTGLYNDLTQRQAHLMRRILNQPEPPAAVPQP